MFAKKMHRFWLLYGLAVGGVSTLSAQSLCPGDANGDNIVDPLDTGFVLSRLGCDAVGNYDCALADLNEDGVVDPLDAGFALSRFGTCTSFNPIFGTPVYVLDGAPLAVTSADLDGDGWLEIIAAEYTNDRLMVLKLDSEGQYSQFDIENTGDFPANLVPADLDGDDDLDLAVVNSYDDTLSLFENDGAAGLGSVATVGVGTDPTDVATADLNGDGRADLITTNNDDATLTVLTNNGGYDFTLSTITLPTDKPHRLESGDLDLDGDADLAISADDGLVVFRNDGSGGFDSGMFYNETILGYPLALADLDADGDLDAAMAATLFDEVFIFWNQGNGDMSVSEPIALPSDPNSIATGDLDGDGSTDLAITCSSAKQVALLYGDGTGGFSEASIQVGTQPRSVSATDLNRDGHSDLLLARSAGKNLMIVLNSGTGFVDSNVLYEFDDYHDGGPVALGHFDGDSYLDAAIAQPNQDQVQLLMSDSSNGLQIGPVLDSDGFPNGIVATDVNDDGFDDLLTSNNSGPGMAIAVNSGCDLPSPMSTFAMGSNPVEIDYGDLDGNRFVDPVIINYDSSPDLEIAITNSEGVPADFISLDYGFDVYWGAVADFSGDGLDDIIVNGDDLSFFLILNQGQVKFEDPFKVSDTIESYNIVTGDLDGDSLQDFVTIDLDQYVVAVFLNNGDGGFARSDQPFQGSAYEELALGDIDLDGDLDIVVPVVDGSYGDGLIETLLNRGDGTFQPPLYSFVSHAVETIDLGDIDNDGDLDVFLSTWSEPYATLVLNRHYVCVPNEPCPTAAPPPDGFVDCNLNAMSDECEVRQGTHFPVELLENQSGLPDSVFVGPPDGTADGIEDGPVTYDIGSDTIIDGEGPDLTVYEKEGYDDFALLSVSVSGDGVQFVDISESVTDVVRIPGDEAHDDDQAARSYDLSGSGILFANYVRVENLGFGGRGFWGGFKLDAIGIVHTAAANDCNQNQIPDDCDISDGTSPDDDQDGVPDECTLS